MLQNRGDKHFIWDTLTKLRWLASNLYNLPLMKYWIDEIIDMATTSLKDIKYKS